MRIQLNNPTLATSGSAREAALWLVEHGLPHRKLEHWRMTSIAQLLQQDFTYVQNVEVTQALAAYQAQFVVDGDALLVLVAGAYRPELSLLSSQGLQVHVGQNEITGIDFARLPFAAQNIAQAQLATVGIALHAGCRLDGCLHVVNIHPDDAGVASFMRVNIELEEGAEMCVLEAHISSQDASLDNGQTVFSNSLVHARIADGAKFSHYKLQNLGLNHTHIAANISTIGNDALLDGFVLNMGGQLVRQDSEIIIAGTRATATLNGAYIVRSTQHIDNTSQIRHDAPDSFSREVYKGVLSDQGKGVFQARIRVDQCAQRTDAYQMNRAILLSSQAEVQSKPELEIYADDVKCSHGATVGQLDEAQLFYLMARGISRKQAQIMLIDAYLDDVFADMQNTSLVEKFSELARQKLHQMALDCQ